MSDQQPSGWAIGWTAFAGIMMIIMGGWWVIAGLVGLFNSEFYVVTLRWIFEFDISTWAWIHLILGIVILVAGFFLFTGATWARVIAVDARGKAVDAKPGTKLKIAAAELAFPGAQWNLAFAFTPPQPVTFNGTEMKFQIGCLNEDAWSVGFCEPGELDAWRKGQ